MIFFKAKLIYIFLFCPKLVYFIDREVGLIILNSVLELLTSGSSGKMLSTSLLYLGLSAPQQPQTPEEDTAREGRIKNHNRFVDI